MRRRTDSNAASDAPNATNSRPASRASPYGMLRRTMKAPPSGKSSCADRFTCAERGASSSSSFDAWARPMTRSRSFCGRFRNPSRSCTHRCTATNDAPASGPAATSAVRAAFLPFGFSVPSS